MDRTKQKIGLLYLVVFVVALLPLFGGYLSNADGNIQWLEGGKILFIQSAALWNSYLLFRFFGKNSMAILFGVTLYVLSPYRFDLCYVQNELKLSAAWALVPLFLYSVMKAVREEGKKRCMSWLVFAAVVLAMTGYGNNVMFCILVVLTILTSIGLRKISLLLIIGVGAIIWLPGNMDFVLYLFTDRLDNVAMPIQNIIAGGYTLNDFMTSFAYHQGKPGLGIGFLTMAALFSFVQFVNGEAKLSRESRYFGICGILSLFMATQYFPWEMVQRIGDWSLKFVSLMETPALFCGFAALLLPTVFISVVDGSKTLENHLPAGGILIFAWMSAVGVTIFLCHKL